MDELLIDEKRYVSSKQAAKMTGYAKDYIGQLCREGRVPARLVGRSWYVLETAIQDHRFGYTDIQPEEVIQSAKSVPVLQPKPTWESPRYETSSDKLLPSVNRLRNAEVVSGPLEESSAPDNLQDSWRAWFDRVANTSEVADPPVEPTTEESDTKENAVEEEDLTQEPVNIPIHTVYELPPENLLPRHSSEVKPTKKHEEKEQTLEIAHQERRTGNRGVVRLVQIGGGFLAIAMTAIAVVGSGYLDKYIISHSQVRIIAGISLYNK